MREAEVDDTAVIVSLIEQLGEGRQNKVRHPHCVSDRNFCLREAF